jgi:hypothetical protein
MSASRPCYACVPIDVAGWLPASIRLDPVRRRRRNGWLPLPFVGRFGHLAVSSFFVA